MLSRLSHWLPLSACAAAALYAMPVRAIDIASQGLGITGHAALDNGTMGVMHDNAGGMGNVNDGNLGSRVDTFTGGSGVFDFTGVLFPGGPINGVQSISIRHAVFFDGGWYGPTAGPGPGGSLAAGDLTPPKVQVTTDLGKTWVDAASTNNYLATHTGHPLPAVAFGAPTSSGPATFTLNSTANGINGIRLLGNGGGAADGNGFLGVFEIGVEATQAASRNLARDGYGIIGNVTVDDGSFGVLLPHAGAPGAVNDGNTSTQVDTWAGFTNGDFDFAGVILPYTASGVESVTLMHHVFGDGGWFGTGANAFPLSAANVVAPKIQATSDFGQTWFDVATTDDYVAQLTGSFANDPTKPATFTFTSPLSGVNGFRAIGNGGGTAGPDGNGFIGVAEFALAGSANAPVNISQLGSGIIGHNTVDNGSTGFIDPNAGTLANINDKNVTTRVDTWEPTSGPFDFVGLTFATPQDDVNGVAINHAIFFDGGWFGTPGAGPGPGGVLSASDIMVPKVQYTLDGVTWIDLPSDTNYLDMLLGHPLPAVAFGAPTSVTATFTFDAPDGIRGIRLFGEGGGLAGPDGNGFIGVFEFAAITGGAAIPEPGTLLMGVLGAGGLALRRRRIA